MITKNIDERILERYGNVNYEVLEYTDMRSLFKVKCLECGNVTTIQYASNFFKKNRKAFCVYCANTYKGDKIGKMLSIEEAQERIDAVLPNEYKIIPEKYMGWSRKGIILHKCGKYFECQPRDLLYHSHCPCIRITSKGEDKIRSFLITNNIDYEEQKRLKEISKAPFDFYLPKFNLLIEFQGRQHYEPVEKFGGEAQLKVQQEIDGRKKQIAEKNGYNIFYISYKQLSEIDELLVQRLSLTKE